MWKETLIDLSNQTTKQNSKMYCKNYAKSQPWASSWELVWQSRSGSSAILWAEISVGIGNQKVKHFVYAWVFVCFLFFYGYKTENRWVQKTQLAFTAAKLYISNLLWVTRQRAAACPSPGGQTPQNFVPLKNQMVYRFSQKGFPIPNATRPVPICLLAAASPGWLLLVQVSFIPPAVLQRGLGL